MDLTIQTLSIEDVMRNWLGNKKPNTQKSYSIAVKAFVTFLAKTEPCAPLNWGTLSKVSGYQAKQFLLHLAKERIANTISIYLAAMRSFYDELEALHMVVSNPFRGPNIKLPRGYARPISPTEAMSEGDAALLLSLPDRTTDIGKRDYAIMAILLGAGLRRSEALALRSEDIHRTYDYTILRLYGTKTATMEERSIAPWVANALDEWLAVAPAENFTVFELSAYGLYKLFKRYVKKAGISGRLSPHSARATFVTMLLDRGATYRDVQRATGHRSQQMVERYDRRRNDVGLNPALQLVIGGMVNGQRKE